MTEFPSPQPAPERAAWVPYLSDRADGVAGHYAIARWNPAGYREVWNLRSHRWASASDDVMSLEEADSLLRQIVIPTVKPAPVAQTFTEGHCAEKRKPGGCRLHNLHCGYPACDRKAAAPSPAVAAEPTQRAATYSKLWARHGHGDDEWWSLGKLQARKEGDDWVVRRKGAEVARHEFLQVAMAEADTDSHVPVQGTGE